MSLDEMLDVGLHSIPGCESICYVDMPTRLVLASQSRKPRPQEVYDAIADSAVRMLRGAGVSAVGPSDADARRVCLFGGVDVQVFVQPKAQAEHALCCVCDLGADLDAITGKIEELRENLEQAL